MKDVIEHDPGAGKVAVRPPAVRNNQSLASPMDMKTVDFKRGLKRRKSNRDALMEWVRESLVAGTDFMRVKSKKTRKWSKPFLSKAGAEKICGMLGVTATYPGLDEAIGNLSSGGEVFVVVCDLTNQDGVVVGRGAGGRTLKQDGYDINKCIKMGLKSAMIDATLRLGGLSEAFTQDEDSAHDDDIESTITQKQVVDISKLADEIGMPLANVERYFDVPKIELLPASKYLRCIKALNKKKEEAKNAAE